MPAAWIGAGAAAIGAVSDIAGSGGGGSSSTSSNGSIGQGIGNILSGGLSTALGIQGLSGGNENQLQAGAAAANPFGSQSNSYYAPLQQLLGGGLAGEIQGNSSNLANLIQSMMGSSGISTNTNGLSAAGNISTPTQTSAIQNLLNNPTQLISSLQGGGVSTPSALSAVANQNPYALNAGEQFQEQQGLGALNASLAATGQVGSGNQMVAAEQYGQNFASQAQASNISQMESAQSSINSTATTNQGLQSIVNQMGQNQIGNQVSAANLLTGQQQDSFNNQLSTQQLQSTQQQNSQINLQNLMQMLSGVTNTGTSQLEGLIPGLLTTTQAGSSSPATAGGILANLGVANQSSGSNIASGLGGLASGIGGLASSLSFGSGGSSGSENAGAASTSTPDDLISGYTG